MLQVQHGDAEWKSILTSGQYRVLRRSGTELPWSSPLEHVSYPILVIQSVHSHTLQVVVSSAFLSMLSAGVPPVTANNGAGCVLHKHASVKKQLSMSTGETQWHIQVCGMWQPSLRVPVKV